MDEFYIEGIDERSATSGYMFQQAEFGVFSQQEYPVTLTEVL